MRNRELLDMRKVPFAAKFTVSSLMAVYMCSRLWDSHIYEAELYNVALKYRKLYDKEYTKLLDKPSE